VAEEDFNIIINCSQILEGMEVEEDCIRSLGSQRTIVLGEEEK
jgi:hypothetical protein